MCLLISKERSQKYKAKFPTTATVYKVLLVKPKFDRLSSSETNESQVKVISPAYYMEWTPGEVKSSTRSKGKSSFRRNYIVSRGIHVYTTRKPAIAYQRIYATNPKVKVIVVKLEAKMTDFLGCSHNEFHAVFTKVTLSQKEYNKAIRAYRKTIKAYRKESTECV